MKMYRCDGHSSTEERSSQTRQNVVLSQILRTSNRHAPTQRRIDRLSPLRFRTDQLAVPAQWNQFLDGKERGSGTSLPRWERCRVVDLRHGYFRLRRSVGSGSIGETKRVDSDSNS